MIKKKVNPVGHNVVALRAEDVTPEINLRDALEEAPHYKHCLVIMLDENEVPAMWGTPMTAAQYALIGVQAQNFAMAMVMGENSPTEYEGSDE
jgi:hypothetical protein